MPSRLSTKPEPTPLLEQPLARAVWTVSWPMICIGLLKSAYYLCDSFWVGKLGAAPLAALGGSAFAWWMIHVAAELSGTGTHTLVARHEGKKERESIGPTAAQGLWLALATGLALAFLCYPLRPLYFDLLGFARDSAEHAEGQAFLGASLLGALPLAIHAVISGVFRGLGDTRTALVITAFALVSNALLDPLFIWGLGPIPGLGIAGAAWATATASGLGAGLGALLLIRRHVGLRFQRPKVAALHLLLSIGLPVAGSGLGFSLVYVLLGRIITPFGSYQMAALGVGHRLEGTAYMVCVAFNVGAATLVGQWLGAGAADKAMEVAGVASRLCLVITAPMAAALWFLAPWLFSIFTEDPQTIEAGVLYLRVQTIVVPFMALETVYQGAFAGSGDTLPSFWITVPLTAVRLPLAWYFAHPLGLGAGGIWLAIATTTFIKGLLLRQWFRRGAWTQRLSEAGV